MHPFCGHFAAAADAARTRSDGHDGSGACVLSEWAETAARDEMGTTMGFAYGRESNGRNVFVRGDRISERIGGGSVQL